MVSELSVLETQRVAVLAEADEVLRIAQERAEGGGEPITDAEEQKVTALQERAGRLKRQSAAMSSLREEIRNAPASIIRAGDDEAPAGLASSAPRAENPWLPKDWASKDAYSERDRSRLWDKGFGEFMQAVWNAGKPGGSIDQRLLAPQAAASGMNTTVPSDGGFLVGTDFSTRLLDRAVEASQLAPLCDTYEVSDGNDGVVMPYVDETSRATGSRWGGVQVYRAAEAATVTASRPKIGELEIRLADMMGIAYATERTMRDAPVAARILSNAFESEFGWKLDNEIFRGNGNGECAGVLNADCLVTISKESGQSAATIVPQNIVKMRSRLLARSRKNSVWLANQDIEPQLHLMFLTVGAGGVPVYMPAGGLSGLPYDTLYGRPVIPVEQASTLGTVGDLVLADFSHYILAKKGGLQADESIHVRFLYNERTFRWLTSINGRPRDRSALTPANGSNTQSAFVTLESRS